MIVYTDSLDFTAKIFPEISGGDNQTPSSPDPNLQILTDRIFHDRAVHRMIRYSTEFWKYLIIIEKSNSSQFDLLVELVQEGITLPGNLLCLAGSGINFHGQRNRPWEALEGNIHLTIHLAPNKKISHHGVAFTVLSAVACIESLKSINSLKGRAGIKWVNDIMIDNAKVGGVLTHTQSVDGTITSAILGIGLNIEAKPVIKPDRFVPEVTCLRDRIDNPSDELFALILDKLLKSLDTNYHYLLDDNYNALIQKYRKYSLIKNHSVEIVSDPIDDEVKQVAAGIVLDIGDNLELYLQNAARPITKGRLIMKS